ncbi:hypothetical protein [Consotaella aegiceratis]|uniref:hypothetical protein n=1 Tax=Consotaella aegiceratis TaxID=3097961 RepID=UPI002F41D993
MQGGLILQGFLKDGGSAGKGGIICGIVALEPPFGRLRSDSTPAHAALARRMTLERRSLAHAEKDPEPAQGDEEQRVSRRRKLVDNEFRIYRTFS